MYLDCNILDPAYIIIDRICISYSRRQAGNGDVMTFLKLTTGN